MRFVAILTLPLLVLAGLGTAQADSPRPDRNLDDQSAELVREIAAFSPTMAIEIARLVALAAPAIARGTGRGYLRLESGVGVERTVKLHRDGDTLRVERMVMARGVGRQRPGAAVTTRSIDVERKDGQITRITSGLSYSSRPADSRWFHSVKSETADPFGSTLTTQRYRSDRMLGSRAATISPTKPTKR